MERGERRVDVLVVGAGQSGLGVAYWLTRAGGLEVLALDAAPVGQTWLDRWDSLTLFTPRRFSSLPGMPFPRGRGCPSRIEMADYLRAYARRFDLPVHTGVRVHRLVRQGAGFLATTSDGPVLARHVVIATGPFHRPRLPAGSGRLEPAVWQLHSSDYSRPSQVPAGPVLVVGGGNSAAQLAVELAATHEVTVAAPRRPWFIPERVLGISTYWWTWLSGVLNADRDARASRYVRRRGDAIVGRQLQALVRQGRVRLVTQRVAAAGGMAVHLQDGTELPVSAVLWCTGFLPDTAWIKVPGATDDDGAPVHDAGASPVPGLHWLGLPWQTRLNSSIIDGVDRDARATAERIRAAGPGDVARPAV